LKFFATDEVDKSVAAFAVFHGTQTGPGGSVPATETTIAADWFEPPVLCAKLKLIKNHT